ncbi:inositol polyphosphate 5-phosphatase OCRL-like [Macrosteles quadrilineatus]|uniref:inositol polyphosphate 5-phosphatase OCRL-like n=1 Tax=Macrosteles quadrilineatus TaxID=74068 RepID=UPI0023E1177C|nr:inositol polyphosphate 5-phosphatase OCRL-like [Macrosteles quadrilineatus]
MANAELAALVVAKLSPGPGEHVAVAHEASLMQGWVRTSRILALLEKDTNYALIVFLSSQTPPIAYSELTIERVLPINSDFKCDIDTESRHQDGTDVYITSRKLKLLFEMVPGNKTSNFVSEVLRAIDLLGKKRNGSQDFSWLNKYNPVSTGADDNAEDTKDPLLLDSPEMAVPRQSIAKGHTPIAARESVIRYQMAMKEDDYTYTQTLRVFVGTWNVNGQPPMSVSLQPWLACDSEPPDIYAVGFQELDLSKEAFLFHDSPREEEWRQVVIAGLHPKAEYQQVALVRLVGMMLLVFVQKHHYNYIRNAAFETVGTGIMGKMGNKGGVSVRFELHNTSLCFVNSHLAAHVEEFERRNQDFHDICSRTSFSTFLPPKGIKDHDQVYWLGDLNYRITELEPNIVKKYIEQQNYRPVLEYDQLRRQHREKAVFVGYTEGDITFRPTYKYDPGSDDWDSSEKNRAPAWCDRVLWKGEGIRQIEYRSHPVLRISDHKPVSAVFSSDVRVIDAVKFRKIHEDVMKKLDKLENEFLPQVMVDNTEIIFDTLRFLEAQTRELIIANTGQVPVQFEFIKKLDDSNYCKEWLNIEPNSGFIMPGEKCDIRLEVYVDKKSACKMNSGQDQLYDILVLHLEGGKDIFITVTGTYERSCFGSSIEALVHMNVPVREIPAGKIIELENNKGEGLSGSPPYMVPKEIWYLVDHLYRHALKTQHLFENPGLHSELIQIRNWLDVSPNDPLPGSVHSVAEALLLLLESTAEPIIPYNLQNGCLGASSNYLACKQFVMQLPDTSKNVFLYLCFFLQELLSHSSENQLDGKTLATLFGAIFMREPPRSRNVGSSRSKSNQQEADRKKANFVYHFLVNDTSELVMGCS